MKKLMLMLTVMAVVLAGCTKKDTASAEKAEPVASATEAGTPGAEIELRALIGAWNTMASTVPERKDYYEAALLEWAEQNPNVRIEIEGIPGGQTAQAMTKLLTAALAGNPHDFANIASNWLSNFHEADVLTPIDNLIPVQDQNQYFDFTKTGTMRDGKLYALWAETGCLLYYYNTKYTPEAPKTWNDIFALSEQLKSDGSNVTPFLSQGKGGAAAFCFSPLFWSQGGKFFDTSDDYRPAFGDGADRDILVNTLNFYKEAIDNETMPPEFITYQHVELQSEAKADRVATMIAGSWVNSALDQDLWSYSSLPLANEGDASANIFGGWTFAFLTKDETKLSESVDFIQHVFTGKDGMTKRLPLHGYIPTRKDVFDTEPFQSPFYAQLYKELDQSQGMPSTTLWPILESHIEEALGKVASGTGTVDEIADQLYDKMMVAYSDR